MPQTRHSDSPADRGVEPGQPQLTRRRTVQASVLALAVFAYAVWFRTHGIADSFALRGDQIRDWSIALRSLSDPPLTGVPSTAGGSTIGPAYYWFLWVTARVIGPFADYLPHTGGIGVALAHSASDSVLFLALARRVRSLVLSAGLVLLIVSSPYDATLSGTIWNPPIAEAFAKTSIGLLLWHPSITLSRGAAISAASWLALHCHTGAIIVAAPILLFLLLRPTLQRRWRFAGQQIAISGATIALLQVPWFFAPPPPAPAASLPVSKLPLRRQRRMCISDRQPHS